MTILSVTEMRDDSNTATVTKDGVEYSAQYYVKTNGGAALRNKEILAYFLSTVSLPYPGRTYSFGGETDSTAYCESITPKQIRNKPEDYIVSAKWKNNDNTENPPSPDVAPESWAPEMDVGELKETLTAEKMEYVSGFTGTTATLVIAGDILHPANSCLVAFDPKPTYETSGRILKIKRWYPTTSNLVIDDTAFPRDVVNSALVYIIASKKKVKIEQYQGKIDSITFSNVVKAGKQVIECNIEIHVRPPGMTWRYELLDQGFAALATNGLPDGRGGTMSAGDFTTTKAIHRPLADKFGSPLSDPVLLNGGGEPLSSIADPVYITYKKYTESAFLSMGMLSGIASAS